MVTKYLPEKLRRIYRLDAMSTCVHSSILKKMWETEVLRKLEVAKTIFNNLRKILSNMNITMKLRMRLVKCFVLSVLMYGCEVWTMYKILRWRININVKWILRRRMRIPWTARVTNKRVIEILTTETWLSNDFDSAIFGLNNYTIFSCDRSHDPHGGVALAIQNCIKSPISWFEYRFLNNICR